MSRLIILFSIFLNSCSLPAPFIPLASASETRDVTHIDRSVITETIVEGWAPACSRLIVEPPNVIADFSGSSEAGEILMDVSSCKGMSQGILPGSWPYGDDDSWRHRESFLVGSTRKGGEFRCVVNWWIDKGATGPVEFIAKWSVRSVSGCEKISKNM
jgi:hypothetical protein